MSGPFVVTPVLGADFKTFEQVHWTLDVNVVGGLEFARAGALRRFRVLVNYYHGNNPYGQFYGQKVEVWGLVFDWRSNRRRENYVGTPEIQLPTRLG